MKMFSRPGSSGGYKGAKKTSSNGPWKPKFDNRETNSRGGEYVKPELFPATCNECGKDCEVPFKPNGRKPVYCRDCFKKDEGGESKSFGDRKPAFKKFDRPSFGDKRPSYQAPISKNYDEQFEVINEKLDEIIAMLAAE